MNTINPWSTNSPATSAAPARQEVSFNQRHAWMRAYEHAEHGASSGTETRDNSPRSSDLPVRNQSHAGTGPTMIDPISHKTMTAPGQRSPSILKNGAERQSSPAQPAFTSTAAWLAPVPTCSSLETRLLPSTQTAATTLVPRPKLKPEQEISEREVTVVKSDGSLSVTVRDAALHANHGLEILHGLNASGASLGLQRVSVTVNGRSTEQIIHSTQE